MIVRKLRRSYECKDQIVTYYHCHRSGNKKHLLLDIVKKKMQIKIRSSSCIVVIFN